MSQAKNVMESFRDVVQDLLVPELKAVKVSIDSLHSEIGYLRTEMKLRDEKMEQMIRHGDEKMSRRSEDSRKGAMTQSKLENV